MKYLISMAAVVITRDAMTVLPRELPSHEVPVAQAVFGEDSVEIIEENNGEAVEIDVEGEADRLVQKYGSGAVEATFGTNFKTAIAKAIKAAGKELADKDEADAGKPIDKMSKDELLAEAEARGVEVDPASNKAKIIEAIKAAG